MSEITCVSLVCDYDDGEDGLCEEESEERGDLLGEVRRWAAKHEGWTYVNGLDFCPDHSERLVKT